MANEQQTGVNPPSVNLLLEMLHEVLEPLGEHRDEVMAWIQHETKTRPIVAFMVSSDKAPDGQGGQAPLVWKLGDPSPYDESTTVFAMLEDPDARTVTVFSFQAAPADDAYTFKTQFFREVVFDPKFVSGPIHHDALFAELRAHLLEEDDEEIAMRVLMDRAEQEPDQTRQQILLDVAASLDPRTQAQEESNGQASPSADA